MLAYMYKILIFFNIMCIFNLNFLTITYLLNTKLKYKVFRINANDKKKKYSGTEISIR